MYKKCEYCGNQFQVFHNSRFCSKTCQSRAYREKHIKKPTSTRKNEYQKRAEEDKRRQKRRNAIYKLMRETGIQYGEVSAFYDKNDIDGLYKKARYLKSIGEIKEETPEARIVKSHGGKITGGFDYFMISTK